MTHTEIADSRIEAFGQFMRNLHPTTMMAAADSSEPRRQGSSRGRRQIEERAVAIGKKVAPLLDPSSIVASLDTLATAAYQLQNAEPDVSEGLTGLAVILQAARTSQTVRYPQI